MSEIYENLSPNGHESMLVRIFTKIKNWVETVFQPKTVTMTYTQYNALSEAQKMDGTERVVTDCPDGAYCWFDETTGTMWFAQSVAQFDEATGTFWIGI